MNQGSDGEKRGGKDETEANVQREPEVQERRPHPPERGERGEWRKSKRQSREERARERRESHRQGAPILVHQRSEGLGVDLRAVGRGRVRNVEERVNGGDHVAHVAHVRGA